MSANKQYAQRRCRIIRGDPKFRSGVTSTFADVAYLEKPVGLCRWAFPIPLSLSL
jgi:hypothetical protein